MLWRAPCTSTDKPTESLFFQVVSISDPQRRWPVLGRARRGNLSARLYRQLKGRGEDISTDSSDSFLDSVIADPLVQFKGKMLTFVAQLVIDHH